MPITKHIHKLQEHTFHTDKIDGSFSNNKKQNILFVFSLIVLVSIILISFFSFSNRVVETLELSSENQLIEVTTQSRDVLQNGFESLISNLKTTANNIALYDDFSNNKIKLLLKKEGFRNEFIRLAVTQKSGTNFSTDNVNVDEIASTDTYAQALKGYPSISEPVFSN
ncbi:MAG: hypothetical protein RSA79_06345 [Oscillospiraceae bacterium]